MSGTVQKSACLSEDGLYRYSLRRTWDGSRPPVVFVGLNPSTADGTQDDPTIRREMAFARRLGFGGLLKVNLYAFRATDPKALREALKQGVDAFGPVNLAYVLGETELAERVVVAAWGKPPSGVPVPDDLAAALSRRPLLCLGTTKDGHPRHPLYLRADAEPRPWTGLGEGRS